MFQEVKIRAQQSVARLKMHIKKPGPFLSPDLQCYSIIILSCCFFSLSSLFTDFIEQVPVIEILWWRFFMCTIICIFSNFFSSQPMLVFTAWRDRSLLVSALCGTITATCTVFALRNLPIGEATLLLTTAPAFTVLLSSIFLKEQLQISDFIVLLISTAGVIFVAQPDFIFGSQITAEKKETIYYIAIFVALARGFFKATKFVAVSSTGTGTTTHVIVLYLSSMGLTALTIINTYQYVSKNDHTNGAGVVTKKTFVDIPSTMNFVYMLLMSVFYFMQQFCVCAAMRYGKPAKASLLKYFDIVLPFVFQVTIFKQYPNVWSILGCILIMLAMLTVIVVPRPKPNPPLPTTNQNTAAQYTPLKSDED